MDSVGRFCYEEINRLKGVTIGGTEAVNNFLKGLNSTPLNNGISLAELIRRPELNYEAVAELDKERPELRYDVKEQVNINIKYEKRRKICSNSI